MLVSVYGFGDELLQGFTPDRSMEFADWVADTLGAAVAVVAYLRWNWYRRALETPLRRNRGLLGADALAATQSVPPA